MAVATRMVAVVKFDNSDKTYEYEVPEWLEIELEEGTTVRAVVDAPYSGYEVVEVIETKARLVSDWDGEFKPLVDLVDMKPYDEYLAQQTRKEQIKRELRRRSEELGEMRVLEELAAGDPESEALLEELRGMGA